MKPLREVMVVVAVPAVVFLILVAAAADRPAPMPELCDATVTQTGGGYYRVFRQIPGDVQGPMYVSQHTHGEQAQMVAIQTETVDPSLDVWVEHDYHLRVECPIPAPPVDSAVASICIARLVDGVETPLGCSDDPLPDTSTSQVGLP